MAAAMARNRSTVLTVRISAITAGAGLGAAGAGATADRGAVAAAGAAAAGAGAAAAPGGSVGNLIVGAAEGLGGRLIRTVSFLGWTFPVSFFGGTAPLGTFGMFSAITLRDFSLNWLSDAVKRIFQGIGRCWVHG